MTEIESALNSIKKIILSNDYIYLQNQSIDNTNEIYQKIKLKYKSVFKLKEITSDSLYFQLIRIYNFDNKETIVHEDKYKLSELENNIDQFAKNEFSFFNKKNHTPWAVKVHQDYDRNSDWNTPKCEINKLFDYDCFTMFDEINGLIDIRENIDFGGIYFIMCNEYESLDAVEKLRNHQFFKDIMEKFFLIIEPEYVYPHE